MRLMLLRYRVRPVYESIFKRQTARLATSFTPSEFVTPAKTRFVVPSFSIRGYHQAAMSTANPTPEEPAKPVEDKTEPEVEELPPLSDRDFKIYNRLAVKMDYFHDHFRRSWNLLWTACTTNKRPQGMSLKQFLLEGIQFADHLTAHHGIEETYLFPMLAKKMPEFRGGRAELLRQHKQIHAGLDVFAEYLRQCRAGEADFEMVVLKEKMEGWGEVLWRHLDEEVKTLGAENMRRYWTKEEIMRLPM